MALPAPERSRWRQGTLQIQPQILQRATGWDGCGPFLSEGLRCIAWNTGGLVGSVFSRQKHRESKLIYLKKVLDHNNNICLQEVHGKDEFLQAIQVLAPQFRLFGTFLPDNENAGGSAICIHTEEVIVTHSMTCHGRDHLLNIRSELTLRQLRGRLGLFRPHWPSYPNGASIFLGDFNICDPEEGRFHVWDQTFTDPRKTAMFHSFFPHVLEVAQSDYTRRDSTALGDIRTLSKIDRIFINLPMTEKHVIPIALLMLTRTSGRKLIRLTMLQYASSSRNLLVEDTTTNVFPAGCPNIPFLVLCCSSIMTTTDSLLTRLVHLQSLRLF